VARAPSKLRILPSAQQDIADIKQQDPDSAQRLLNAIKDWERQIGWGRVPQTQLTYLTGSKQYNFYREQVGRSGHRVVYEISDDLMTAVAAFEKDDNAYDLDEYRRRMDRVGSWP